MVNKTTRCPRYIRGRASLGTGIIIMIVPRMLYADSRSSSSSSLAEQKRFTYKNINFCPTVGEAETQEEIQIELRRISQVSDTMAKTIKKVESTLFRL